jgi:segregation and condensation protein B
LEILELKATVEALLFASDKPLTLAQLAATLDGAERKAVHQVLDELRTEVDEQNRGFRLVEIAEGWQLVSRPQHAAAIRRLSRAKGANRLSRPALETLAIIAYKQPLTKTDIENIRGVNSDGVMHNLLERRLVRTVGRKDVVGRPLLYGTTREFLQIFGLKDLVELPKLTELKELLQQEPEAELWDIGPDGKLTEKHPEDFVKSPSEELLDAKAKDSDSENVVDDEVGESDDEDEEFDEDDDEDEEDDDEDDDDDDDDDD